MKREEIDNLLIDFDEMGFCPTPFNRNSEAYACQWRDNMRNAIIKHEQDILKEFVEWYKNVLQEDYDDKVRWMADRRKEKDMKNYYSYHGECSAISRLITLLDGDLKKFLKEMLNNDK